MRVIQFVAGDGTRRVGIVRDRAVLDVTALRPDWPRVYDIFEQAQQAGTLFEDIINRELATGSPPELDYDKLWSAAPGDPDGWLLPPVDHPDPAHCIVGGTGLTHLGSTASRDAMHKDTDVPKTDSQKMFDMGLESGKPTAETRGIAPECFYKGSGLIIRGHREQLDIPAYAMDGGEEPEIVGCYIIGSDGVPYRLGFSIANEWSDHAMEKVNYLWLAPSKLRTCAVGPELVTDEAFCDLRGRCTIRRGDQLVYDSDELLTGEDHMSHSLANLEDHHFKHAQFRQPGDLHIYFFGTMKLSYGQRGPLADGDVVEIHFDGMSKPLINPVRKLPPDDKPTRVRKA